MAAGCGSSTLTPSSSTDLRDGGVWLVEPAEPPGAVRPSSRRSEPPKQSRLAPILGCPARRRLLHSALLASRMLGMAAVAAAVAVVSVAGNSAARTERAADGSAPRSKFVSKRYGYELVLTGRYFHQYATVAWSGSFPFGNGPDIDGFYDGQDRKFIHRRQAAFGWGDPAELASGPCRHQGVVLRKVAGVP